MAPPLETTMRTEEEEEQVVPYDPSLPPLDRRVLSIIKTCPNYTIRPAKLAAELGISMDDACAELCGVLSAVGGGKNGASFVFESSKESGTPPTMVFTFPSNFEQRAIRARRRQDWRRTASEMADVFVKLIKIVTAFGLILSLLVVSIAAMIGLVAAVIAMSRSGHNHQRSAALHRLRSLFYTVRQLLFCYAIFGGGGQQNPFMRELAMDLALFTSVCCGNPGSLWFWIRAGQLHRRRQRATRGWGDTPGVFSNTTTSDMQGVALIQRGTWGSDDDETRRNQAGLEEDGSRGLLSIAVEFLFGPTPFHPRPSESDKWKKRGAAIMQMSSKGNGVPLEELSPYSDYPPASLDNVNDVVAGGLPIVAHFDGVPAPPNDDELSTSSSSLLRPPSKARFVFPELMAESSFVTVSDDAPEMGADGTWESLLYVKESATSSFPPSNYLYERRYVLTKLESKQFLYCLGLGVLNYIGVVMLGQSLEPGGMLDVGNVGFLVVATKQILMPVLYFYAHLFFLLPGARLLLIVTFNTFRNGRNQRRSNLVEALASSAGTTTASNEPTTL